MAAVMTQESFDRLVDEIRSDFELSWSEAVVEAREELKLQGMTDLTHLQTCAPEERKKVEFVQLIRDGFSGLKSLAEMCETSAAASADFLQNVEASSVFRTILGEAIAKDDLDHIIACCDVINALASQKPSSSFDLAAVRVNLLPSLQNHPAEHSVIKSLRAVSMGCKPFCEMIVSKGGLDAVIESIAACQSDDAKFALACALLRTICNPEDRGEVADVLGRCRVICRSKNASAASAPALTTERVLPGLLMSVCFDRSRDRRVTKSACTTLSFLARSDDVIEVMRESGIVSSLFEDVQDYAADNEMTRLYLVLVRNLSGNERCRAEWTQKGGVELLLKILQHHQCDARIAELVSSVIAAISLGSSERAETVLQAGGLEVLLDILELYGTEGVAGVDDAGPQATAVVKSACNAFRNLGSRNTNVHAEMRRSTRAEQLLRRMQAKYPSTAEVVHIALRECDMLSDNEYNCPFQSVNVGLVPAAYSA